MKTIKANSKIGKAISDGIDLSIADQTEVLVTVPCEGGKLSFLYVCGTLKATHLERCNVAFPVRLSSVKTLASLYGSKPATSVSVEDVVKVPAYVMAMPAKPVERVRQLTREDRDVLAFAYVLRDGKAVNALDAALGR